MANRPIGKCQAGRTTRTGLGPRVTAVATRPAGLSATAAASVRPGRCRARHRCGVSTSALSRGAVCATSTPAPPGYLSAHRGPPPTSRQAWCGPPTSSTPSHPASTSVPGTELSPVADVPVARSRGEGDQVISGHSPMAVVTLWRPPSAENFERGSAGRGRRLISQGGCGRRRAFRNRPGSTAVAPASR
jgi:hypothetical protein